ncbi:MAG: thiol-disulfide oxidoreductase DCC family protein [Flavobacterium sp.]
MIILFDGVCNLCNGVVKFIAKRDPNKKFSFLSLQSSEGKKLLNLFNINALETDSIVYVKNNQAFIKSKAALEIAKDMGGIYHFLMIFKIFPTKINDYFYDFVAKNRYKFFGKNDSCEI